MLRALLARPGRAVARKERLVEPYSPASDVQPDAIEVVAYRLRKAAHASTGVQLVTLRGLGYLLKGHRVNLAEIAAQPAADGHP